jgi:nitrous oxidase accessory protein NosD
MKMKQQVLRRWLPALTAAAALAAGTAPTRAASFDAIGPAVRFIAGPTVITEPGTYRVAFGFAVPTNTDGIVIRAPSVTLDLGGNTLLGPGAKQGRGIVVEGVSAVLIQNGRLTRWGTGVAVLGAANVEVKGLQIVGQGLPSNPPGGDPPEIGVLIVNSRAVVVADNTVTDVGLGIFVRGGGSQGNRICNNTLTAGSNGLLGICYNPAPGDAATAPGPRGDLVEGNHISRFGSGIAMSAGSVSNIIRGNAIAFMTSAMSPASPPNNTLAENLAVQLP